ncbi:MAG: hypothetical protein JW863_19185 [Chitinispirillaceae bacterium]|nr:hypothetical protein [Chitinispirillaceae bacterium]
MSRGKGVSVPVIVMIGIVFALLSLLAIISVQFLAGHFSPTVANAERCLRRGKIDEGFALAGKIRAGTVARELLRGKLFLARGLQQRTGDGWRSYGSNPADWLQGADADSALGCFNAVLAVEKDNAVAWYFKGVVFKEKGWMDRADDALHEALRLDPASIDTRMALGSLYAQTDRPGEAADLLLEAYRMAPENPQVAKNLAFLYRFHNHNPESSLVWLNRYLTIADPKDIDINRAKTEFNDLLSRYPEYRPTEPQVWRNRQRKFFSRR